jgi:hypothetical protein
MIIVVIGLVAVSARVRYDMYWTGDAAYFFAVARHPFAAGGVSAHPLMFGEAYRYGRIMYPLTAWLLAFGRPSWVAGTLLAVYLASVGAWVAFAAEHLRRNGRRPAFALWIFALPFSLLAFFRPEVVSDPMAGALLFLVYLYERDGRTKAACVAAAMLILTREPMVVALVPLMWMGWKARRFAAVRDWALAGAPYALWLIWVRLRVGQFPFLDPAISRKEALAGPFMGYVRSWHVGADAGQQLGLVFASATLLVAGLVAVRGHWRYPLTHGALAVSALVLFLGVAVFRHPVEAFRVVVPIQALLLVAVLDRGGEPLDVRSSARPVSR